MAFLKEPAGCVSRISVGAVEQGLKCENTEQGKSWDLQTLTSLVKVKLI